MTNRISDENLNIISNISAATMHEALGKIGALPAYLKPISKGMKICGRALPVKGPSGCNLWLHRGIAKAQPNDVIIADVGDDREYHRHHRKHDCDLDHWTKRHRIIYQWHNG